MSAAILTMLGKEIALPIAKSLWSALRNSRGSTDKFQKAIELIQNGSTTLNSLRTTFGADFDRALTQAGNTGSGGWSYEAGRDEYIKITDVVGETELAVLLREELSINLDRINNLGIKNKIEMRNYFRGVFGRWKERYDDLIKIDEDACKTFETIDSLLDGKTRTLKEALKMLTETALGVGGGLLVVSGALLATSTGVGIATMFSTFVFGIPLLSVAGLVIPGVILVVLSKHSMSSQRATSACVAVAHKLLDRRQKRMRNNGSAEK